MQRTARSALPSSEVDAETDNVARQLKLRRRTLHTAAINRFTGIFYSGNAMRRIQSIPQVPGSKRQYSAPEAGGGLCSTTSTSQLQQHGAAVTQLIRQRSFRGDSHGCRGIKFMCNDDR